MRIKELYCKCDKCKKVTKINFQDIRTYSHYDKDGFFIIENITINKSCQHCSNEIYFEIKKI